MISLGLSFASVVLAWNIFSTLDPASGEVLLFTFFIAALVVAVITFFKKKLSVITANIYAVLQGLVLGIVARGFGDDSSLRYIMGDGSVYQAIILSLFTTFAVFLLYKAKIIDVTRKFKMMIVSSSLGVLLFHAAYVTLFPNTMVVSWKLMFACNLFVAMAFAWSMTEDVALVVNASKCKLPEYMSWFSAFWL
jgi:uncharacterized YccA/Bax inhibitor family protein